MSMTESSANLSVAHFGHPLLKGAKHWSLLLFKPDSCTIAYQTTGSTDTYEYKEPEEVDNIIESQTYMGKVDVGMVTVDEANLARFEEVLRGVPITRGNLNWNCQNWVVQSLQALHDNGFDVDALTHTDLGEALGKAKKDT
jgi:hypothetical protein